MVTQEQQLLWSRIQGFSLDDRTAQVTFSDKLAASQNWTVPFAQRAIEEYRKFIFLCCISPKGAAPSKIVDEVWHLHLTYTHSYWIHLCKNALGRDIHHYPSKGGEEEDSKHQQWYAETLQLYRSVFGVNAPVDIWPVPKQEALPQKAPSFRLSAASILVMIGLLLLPFALIAVLYQTWSPFDLGGPHFLLFFLIYAVSVILIYIIYRMQIIKGERDWTAASLKEDISVFQVTSFLYGDHRALQTGILDLIKKGLLETPGYNQFVIKKAGYNANLRHTNPLISAYAREEEGSMLNYDKLMTTWYSSESFSHPALENLKRFKEQPEPFLKIEVFYVAVIGMVLARSIQGTLNGKPIIFLVLEGAALVFLLTRLTKRLSRSAVVNREVSKLYKQRLDSIINPDEQLVSQFAMNGTAAISHWAEGAALSGLFLAYTSTWYGDGTNTGSSGCGSGSSCGGGSSCSGGGGCGGCSGN